MGTRLAKVLAHSFVQPGSDAVQVSIYYLPGASDSRD